MQLKALLFKVSFDRSLFFAQVLLWSDLKFSSLEPKMSSDLRILLDIPVPADYLRN